MSKKINQELSVTREFTVKGDIIESPEGFRIERVPTLQEKRDNVAREIDRIEALKEPTDRELIEWARENHEYYFETNTVLPLRKADLEYYKKQRDGV